MQRQRGFSLIELLIVIAIAMAVVSIGLVWLTTEHKRSMKDEAVRIQAVEMATLSRALDQFLRGSPALPTDGSTRSISLDDLRGAGLIPAERLTLQNTCPRNGTKHQYQSYFARPQGPARSLAIGCEK